jgi:hypothetical protein
MPDLPLAIPEEVPRAVAAAPADEQPARRQRRRRHYPVEANSYNLRRKFPRK